MRGADLETWTKNQLRDACKSEKLAQWGDKASLIKRLEESDTFDYAVYLFEVDPEPRGDALDDQVAADERTCVLVGDASYDNTLDLASNMKKGFNEVLCDTSECRAALESIVSLGDAFTEMVALAASETKASRGKRAWTSSFLLFTGRNIDFPNDAVLNYCNPGKPMKGRCLIIFRVAPAARPAAPPAGPSAALMLGNRSHVLPGPAASKPNVTLAFGFGCQRQGTQLVISPKAAAATAWGAVKVHPGDFTLDELLQQADQVRQREVTKFGSIALTDINTDLFLLNSTPVPMPGTKKTTDTFFIIDEHRAIAPWDEVTLFCPSQPASQPMASQPGSY